MKDKTAIVGIGQTVFEKKSEDTELILACKAIKDALDDAGISASEVDALASYTFEETEGFEIARNLGFGEVHYWSEAPYGGGASCAAIGQVAMSIALGISEVGVVWRSRKRGDPSSRMWSHAEERMYDHWKWSRPSGLVRPADESSMLMRRYLHEFGYSRKDMAHIALSLRKYANKNKEALMFNKELSFNEYMEARMISDPLCLFDNCLESDGAIAVVLVSKDRTKRLKQKPAYIHAYSQGMSDQHQLMCDYHGTNPLISSSYTTAKNLYRQSDYSAADIDVAQFYDAFSPMIPFSMEAYGFCAQGEALGIIADGGINIDGSLPVNTSGGGMSEVYLHGMNLVIEGVRQIRGTSTSQVSGANLSLVTTCDATPNAAILLRGD
jgi:acetyl-CoA acetyltransferase|tara:strand:+ start:1569 stop:2714 length:1146 start_codon:yes stop_codon:yes gene_type:complete